MNGFVTFSSLCEPANSSPLIPMPHILRAHDEAIAALAADIRHMGDLALQNLQNATFGLMKRDFKLCNQAIADDGEVDELEKKIDHSAIDIITRFGPKATDLRRVIASMKVSTSLERISDHCVSLARRAKRISERPVVPETDAIPELSALAGDQLRDSVAAFCDGDLEAALCIQARDSLLDAAQLAFARSIISKLETDSSNVKNYVDLLFITRFIERIGDQSVNIAEDAVYHLTALDTRHGGDLPPGGSRSADS